MCSRSRRCRPVGRGSATQCRGSVPSRSTDSEPLRLRRACVCVCGVLTDLSRSSPEGTLTLYTYLAGAYQNTSHSVPFETHTARRRAPLNRARAQVLRSPQEVSGARTSPMTKTQKRSLLRDPRAWSLARTARTHEWLNVSSISAAFARCHMVLWVTQWCMGTKQWSELPVTRAAHPLAQSLTFQNHDFDH